MRKISTSLLLFLFFFLTFTFPVKAQVDEEENRRLFHLCQVWGYYKYFHPSLSKCNGPDWDLVLVRTIEETENLSNDFVFNLALERFENFVEPIEPAQGPPPNLDNRIADNFDLSWMDADIFSQNVQANLIKIRDNYRPWAHCGVEADRKGSVRFLGERSYSNMPFPKESYRLLALFRFWNVVKYFYPHINKLDKSWEETLMSFIPRIKEVDDEISYRIEMISLFKEMEDAYLTVLSPIFDSYAGFYYAPLEVAYVDGKTVIKSVLDSQVDIQVGSIVTHIDGKEIETVRDSIRKYAWGREGDVNERRINDWLVRGHEGSFEISVENREEARTHTLNRYLTFANYKRALPFANQSAQRLPGNYGYINVERLDPNRVSQTLFNLNSRAPRPPVMVLDLRNTGIDFISEFSRYYLRSPEVYSLQTQSDGRFPGTTPLPLPKSVGFNNSDPEDLVILLIDESTVGGGELIAMSLEAHSKVIKIGSPSAGSAGELLSFLWLPGGISILFNALNATYPDGTPVHRVGIQPDVFVRPTLEDIQAGRDPLLDAAILEAKLQVGIPKTLVFPNPANDQLSLMLPSAINQDITINIYDTLGRLVKQFNAPNKEAIISIDIDDLQRGYYFIHAIDGDQVHAAKFEKI